MTATAQALAMLVAMACGGGADWRYTTMYDAHIQAQIRQAAFNHGLPSALVEAIVEVESGGEIYAARYEPGYRWTVPKAKRPANCTQTTEDIMQCTSIGPMQVMGAVARELGHAGWLGMLHSWDQGLDYGCAHLSRLKARYFGRYGWPGVVAAYNSGSPRKSEKTGLWVNQQYVDKILAQLGGEWPGEVL